jgi:hypothetical protein
MDRTNIFDRIITTIGEKIEPPRGGDVSNVTLCYWLCNTATLLLLLQKNLKPAATPGRVRRLTATTSVSPASVPLSLAATVNIPCGHVWLIILQKCRHWGDAPPSLMLCPRHHVIRSEVPGTTILLISARLQVVS